MLRTLAIGALLSIGLGFFTGGLQHFPDSPERSAWVVPLGFFISVLALGMSTNHPWQRATSVYVLVVGMIVSGGSYGAWQWLVQHPEWAAAGDGHGHSHNVAAHTEPEESVSAMVISRSVELRMDDQMRFTPNRVDAQAGETIRFVLYNDGKTTHEMVLGDEAQIKAHAVAMQQGAGHDDGHSHGTGAAISVPAGQRGEMVVRFDRAQTLQMACLIPGHYEAGMRGQLNVLPATKTDAPKPSVPHDHSTHKH